MDQLPCDTIRDLLPGYIDRVVSEETRQVVKAHLSGCASCRELYEDMAAFPEEEDTQASSGKDGSLSVDYLRKNRQHRWLVWAGLAIAVVIVGAVFLIFIMR